MKSHLVLNVTPIEAKGLSDPSVTNAEIGALLRQYPGAPKKLPAILVLRVLGVTQMPLGEFGYARWAEVSGPMPRAGMFLRVSIRATDEDAKAEKAAAAAEAKAQKEAERAAAKAAADAEKEAERKGAE